MSDMVSSKYKKEAWEWDDLIHALLEYCDDTKIKTTFDKKNIFTEDFGEKTATDMTQYENYIVEDLTWIDIEEIERKIDAEMDNPLFVKQP